MRRRGVPAALLPPFLVGGGLAVAGEVAVGLLLYEGPGLIPALSVILAVLLVALAAGLRSGRAGADPDRLEGMRGGWLFLLVSVALAAFFAGAWEIFRGFGAAAVTQGVGLAVLGALPMYAGGRLLARIGASPGPGTLAGGAGPAALAGGGLGVLTAGHLLFPALSPTAILLTCLVILSAAALLHGRLLDRSVLVDGTLKRDEGGRGVIVERWLRGRPPLVRIAILEGERLRVLMGEDGRPAFPDEALVEEGLARWAPRVRSLLVLGGGAAGLALRALEAEEERRVRLADGNGGLLAAVREDLPGPGRDRLETWRRSPLELLVHGEDPPPTGTFDAAILEWTQPLPGEPLDRIPAPLLGRLRQVLEPRGVLVLCPLGLDPATGEEGLLALAGDVGRHFPRTALYVTADDPALAEDVPPGRLEPWRRARPGAEMRRAVLVAGPDDGAPWPDRLRGFLQVPVSPEGREGVPPPEAAPNLEVPGAPRPSL